MRDGYEPWVHYRCVHCGKIITAFENYNELCEHTTTGTKPKKYTYPFDFIGSNYDKSPSALKKLVCSKNYGELLLNETSKLIIGEEKTRKALIVCLGGGRLVKNSKTTSYNTLISEQSGAGKDYITLNTLKIFPERFWNHKTRLSEKALSYWHPSEKEPYFSWTGKILYIEDASNYFLNSDTVKIMMTGGSDIGVVIDGELKTLKVNGSPLFVITSATAEPNKELNRRLTSTPIDSSEEQTSKILDFQSKIAQSGQPKYDRNLINSTYLLISLTVDIPFSESLLKTFPKNVHSRTNFDRLLDIIKAHAALHQYSRRRKGDDIIEANEEDLKAGLEIFRWLYPSRNTSLTHAQQNLVNYLSAINTSKSATELFRESGFKYYTQVGVMIKALRSLAEKGFIHIFEGDRNGKIVDVYEYIPEINPLDIKIIKINSISNVSKVSKVSKDSISTTPVVSMDVKKAGEVQT